jgi:hypothetical protein
MPGLVPGIVVWTLSSTKKLRATKARKFLEVEGRNERNQRIVPAPVVVAMTGLAARTIVLEACMEAVSDDVVRAVIPTVITMMEAMSDTTTIFTCVPRSAVKIEKLFMGLLPCSTVGRLQAQKGSKRVTSFCGWILRPSGSPDHAPTVVK